MVPRSMLITVAVSESAAYSRAPAIWASKLARPQLVFRDLQSNFTPFSPRLESTILMLLPLLSFMSQGHSNSRTNVLKDSQDTCTVGVVEVEDMDLGVVLVSNEEPPVGAMRISVDPPEG